MYNISINCKHLTGHMTPYILELYAPSTNITTYLTAIHMHHQR